jgi:hypothetical protein
LGSYLAPPLAQVLLSKGVAEANILFICLIAAPEGITKLCSRFPGVKVITSEIDKYVDEDRGFSVIPGACAFGGGQVWRGQSLLGTDLLAAAPGLPDPDPRPRAHSHPPAPPPLLGCGDFGSRYFCS